MKKILLLLLSLSILFALSACGGLPSPAVSNPSDNSSASGVPESDPYEITYTNAKVWTNSIGTTWVQTIIEVTNTGANPLYLSSGAYDLEMPDGSLVASQTMVSVFPAVIDPGEKAYYYEATTLDDGDPGVELTVVPRVDVEKAKVDNIRYTVSDIKLSEGKYSGIKAIGRVENTGAEPESMVYIAIVMYDANDTPIGLMFTIITDEIAAGDKIGFEMTEISLPDGVTADAVARFEAYAYPLQMQF